MDINERKVGGTRSNGEVKKKRAKEPEWAKE
jgi:hypothetical protein